MAVVKIPGIYMLRNRINGKVYIGQSKDLHRRQKLYKWASTATNPNTQESNRRIGKAMREYGFNAFDFIILDCGDKYNDRAYRLMQEVNYIAQYRATDPQYGYNDDRGGDPGVESPRKQSTIERLNRALPIITYNTNTGHSLLYLSGANTLATELGYARTIITRNIKRGSLIAGHLYAFYANKELRDEVVQHLRQVKVDSAPVSDDLRAVHARELSVKAFNDYFAIASQMDEIANFFGF